MVVCAGCNVEFASTFAHTIHLRCTSTPACLDLFICALAYLPKLDESDSDLEDVIFLGIPQVAPIQVDGTPIGNFGGDFFGDDYNEGDFGCSTMLMRAYLELFHQILQMMTIILTWLRDGSLLTMILVNPLCQTEKIPMIMKISCCLRRDT
jgi:hypothetical protein